MATRRALLLTDVVNSTTLTERLGDKPMARLWAAHNRLARDLLDPWRGREIDKSDGLLILFESVSDAVGYALAYHSALASLTPPIRSRAGIHLASVEIRHNSAADIARGAKLVEVEGIAVAVAARIMAAASGGQTLLSETARAELSDDAHALTAHGYWRLQGVDEPVPLFEVAASPREFRAPEEAPKTRRVVRRGGHWVPITEIPHQIPAERDGFIGRRATLAGMVKRLDEGARLVSLIGPGGSGKTRLATHFAWEQLARFADGVWFCDLSQARTLEGVCFGVAQGLELQLTGARDATDQIGGVLAGRGNCLVILDNFEQVAALAETTIGAWMNQAQGVRFLVTSRTVLDMPGESVVEVAPLQQPDAVALFVERARAARAQLPTDADAMRVIDALVDRLDHLPLAIELAAARVRALTPASILARLDAHFDLLARRSSGRQSTLRATYDWSWELLDDAGRTTLGWLSVFEGAFSMSSAEAVLGDPGVPLVLDAFDQVLSLVDQSFVCQLSEDRFTLLTTIRQYAREHLATPDHFPGSGPAGEAAAYRGHGQYFANLDHAAARANRCAALGDLVVACHRAVTAGDVEVATRTGALAWVGLKLTGPYRTALDLAEQIETLTPSGIAGSRMQWLRGDALDAVGESAAASDAFSDGLEAARVAGDAGMEARLLHAIGDRETTAGNLDDARSHLEAALALAEAQEDLPLRIEVLNALGKWADHQGRLEEAQGHYEEGLRQARAVGDTRMEGGLLGNLGGVFHDLGHLEAASNHYQAAIELAEQVGDRRWGANARCNLGLVQQAQGDKHGAVVLFEAALTTARQMGFRRLEYTALCNLGILATEVRDFDAAVTHLLTAVNAAAAAGDGRSHGQFSGYLALALARTGDLAGGLEALRVGEALLRAADDRLSLGLLLCDRAELADYANDPSSRRQALAAASEIATQLQCGPESELGRRLAVLN